MRRVSSIARCEFRRRRYGRKSELASFSVMHKQVSLIFVSSLLMVLLASNGRAQVAPKRVSLAVLDFGNTDTGRLAAEKFSAALATETETSLVDRDLSRAAARGAGYLGSLNL